MPYDKDTEQTLKEDFKRLWATSFLDDLTIEVKDYAFTNGVIGKIVIYHMEERQRVKIVDFVGSKEIEQTKIDEKLREENVQVRMDSFINDSSIRRTKAIIRSMLSEKGYLDSTVTHEVKPMPAQGTKTVHLTFNIEEGPKYIVRDIDFVGNKAVGDRSLKRRMKETKETLDLLLRHQPRHLQGLEIRRGRRKGAGLLPRQGLPHHHRRQSRDPHAEDVGRRQDARHPTGDSGQRRLALQGRHVRVRRQQGGQVRGAEAYLQGEGRRVLQREDHPQRPGKGPRGVRLRRLLGDDRLSRCSSARTKSTPTPRPRNGPPRPRKPAIVDITMHMQEGEQFFVNRITFTGNTVTRDRVIRRETQPRRRRRVQHGSAEIQRQASQSARLLQTARRQRIDPGPEGGGRQEPGRRHAEAGGTEPQPAAVRRRLLAVGRHVHERVVRDVELPRPGRDVRSGGAGRRAREELLSSRSPNRICSIGRSAAASRCSRASTTTCTATTRCSTAKSAPASRSPAACRCA